MNINLNNNSSELKNNYINNSNSQNEQYIFNINNKKNKKSKKVKEQKHRVKRPSDWICNRCHNLNYSFRIVCNICNLPKKENQFYFSNIRNSS